MKTEKIRIRGSFGLQVKLVPSAAEDQPARAIAAVLCHAATSAVIRGTLVGAPHKNRQGSAGRMFPAAMPRLWSCSLHPLAVKWSKSGDIPGMPQKPPVQESLWRESGVGFPRLAAGTKELFCRR